MQERKYSELGSEFWLDDFPLPDSIYALSGRTAIDLILQDLLASGKSMRSVYMPAWCCDSMLQPFIERGVKVSFYDVSYRDGSFTCHIDDEQHTDILYITNYFGYTNTLTTDKAHRFQEKGTLVIYDRTHSLFMEHDKMKNVADYTFASIRKWLGVPCGAYIHKKAGSMLLPEMKDCPYIGEKVEAMTLKAAYIYEQKEDLKPAFLELYGQFGHHLAEDYRNYKMDELSQRIWQHADKQALRKNRCANALLLQVCLKEISQIRLMFNIVKGDCPLFVPVLLNSKEERDALRQHLTTHAIYCPVHWPKPEMIPSGMQANELYDRELSLICDQRYEFNDMQHIVDIIEEYYQ